MQTPQPQASLPTTGIGRRGRGDQNAVRKSKLRQEEFGKRIAEFRQEKKLGVRELSRLAGVSHVQLLNIESGKRNAGIGAAVKLTGALGLSTNDRAQLLHDYLGWHGGHIITGLIAEILNSGGLHATIHSGSQIEIDLGGGLKVKAELTCRKI